MNTNKNYAGFWARTKASFIDGLIVLPIFFILTGWYMSPEQTVQNTISLEIEGLIATFLMIAYEVIMYTEYDGQTVGKRVTGIKVVMEDGSKITYGKALLRTAGGYTSFAILMLGYLWVIWDSKKQAWHDKIAKTLVVKA